MAKKFNVYSGQFVCHKCKSEVRSARFWYSTSDLTWKCAECEHVSSVSLDVRGY